MPFFTVSLPSSIYSLPNVSFLFSMAARPLWNFEKEKGTRTLEEGRRSKGEKEEGEERKFGGGSWHGMAVAAWRGVAGRDGAGLGEAGLGIPFSLHPHPCDLPLPGLAGEGWEEEGGGWAGTLEKACGGEGEAASASLSSATLSPLSTEEELGARRGTGNSVWTFYWCLMCCHLDIFRSIHVQQLFLQAFPGWLPFQTVFPFWIMSHVVSLAILLSPFCVQDKLISPSSILP